MAQLPHRWIHRPKFTQTKRPVALSPGSLVHLGQKRAESLKVQMISYDSETVTFEKLEHLPTKQECSNPDKVIWVNVSGLHEIEKLSTLGTEFEISPLILEDILNTGSRPKIEKRESDIFVVVKLVTSDADENSMDLQHLAFLLLPGNVLISFLEEDSEAFNPVIERIRTGSGGRIRRFGADYLLWALLDATVDNYLFVIDHLDAAIITMDERLQIDASQVEAGELYGLKRDVGQLHRAIRPIREITVSLNRPNTNLLDGETQPFFADLNDHGLQVLETTEDLRESVSALRDFYLSAASIRMNEVMKVLTCFSTIFLPLTFIAGIYGMNFEDMPELKLRWGYGAAWVLFATCAAGMFLLFRKKRWL